MTITFNSDEVQKIIKEYIANKFNISEATVNFTTTFNSSNPFMVEIIVNPIKNVLNQSLATEILQKFDLSTERIPAIKYAREVTQCGLKECKDFVDNVYYGKFPG